MRLTIGIIWGCFLFDLFCAALTTKTIVTIGLLYFALRIVDGLASFYMAYMGHIMGDISFQHVAFEYSDDQNEVLSDIDLTIRAGERVALVGLSGGVLAEAGSHEELMEKQGMYYQLYTSAGSFGQGEA